MVGFRLADESRAGETLGRGPPEGIPYQGFADSDSPELGEHGKGVEVLFARESLRFHLFKVFPRYVGEKTPCPVAHGDIVIS